MAKLSHNLDVAQAQKSLLSTSFAHVSTMVPQYFLMAVVQAAVCGIHLPDT